MRRARTRCAPSCVSRAWWPHSHAERTRRHRPRRGPGLAPRPGPAGLPPPASRESRWVGDIHLYPHPGRRARSAWRPPPAAARRKQSGTRLGRQHAAPTPLCEAIDMAVRRCPHTTGETIFHSDRGCQYTSEQLSQHLGRYEIIASTGRTGVCWDNAWAESFNATLKNERVYQMVHHRKKQGHPGYCLPGRARYTRSETTLLCPGVQDAGRGRPGAPSSKTSSLKDRFQSCPRHAQQPRVR